MNTPEIQNHNIQKEQKRQSKQICEIRHKFCKQKAFGFLGDCAPCKD